MKTATIAYMIVATLTSDGYFSVEKTFKFDTPANCNAAIAKLQPVLDQEKKRKRYVMCLDGFIDEVKQ